MKKLFALFVMIFSVMILSSCYKKETYTFVEGTYALKEDASFGENMELKDVCLSFNEISKEEYENAEGINVITSRYNDKYYSVTLSMNIDGVSYDNITTTERLGSTAYNNRYHLMFKLNIGDQVYSCHFRIDLYNHPWEKEIEEYEANNIEVYLFESRHDEGNGNGKLYAQFKLILNDNEDPLKITNLHEIESWLAHLETSGVTEISIENGYLGAAPGTKSKIEYTDNASEINRLADELKNASIELAEDGSWEIDGGSFKSITISLKSGDKHSIYLGNGFYKSGAGYYRVSISPAISEEKVTRVDFNYGTYNGTQVLMTDVYGAYDAVVWAEAIEDLSFTYGSSNRLYAFNNGIKYTLTEAYENELLTYANLQYINSSYC